VHAYGAFYSVPYFIRTSMPGLFTGHTWMSGLTSTEFWAEFASGTRSGVC